MMIKKFFLTFVYGLFARLYEDSETLPFPNPSSGSFTLKLSPDISEGSLRIYSMGGKLEKETMVS